MTKGVCGGVRSEKMDLLIIQFLALLPEEVAQICCNGGKGALHSLSRMKLLIRGLSPFKWTSL